MPTPDQPVHWIDAYGRQVGPEPLDTVVQRVHAGQIPHTTLVWWEGSADGWVALHQVPDVTLPAPSTPAGAEASATATAAPATAAGTIPGAGLDPGLTPGNATAALMSGMTDDQLDDTFIELIGRSWTIYKETEYANAIDEAMLGGIITALVDCGFVLIDLNTASPWATASTAAGGTGAVDVGSTAGLGHHRLRFEEPSDQSRVDVAIKHLTPDPALASISGHRASAIIGYGRRVPSFTKVGQALKQEVQSSFIVSPEPGTVTFDADMSSGYVYAQIDLLLELQRYVDEHLAVDHDLLRRHLASVIYTMQTFIHVRFGG